jgi:hypothetical protein
MAGAPVAADLDQAPDILINLLAQITLNGYFPVDHFTDPVDFFFGQGVRFGLMFDVGLVQDSLAISRPHTEKIL